MKLLPWSILGLTTLVLTACGSRGSSDVTETADAVIKQGDTVSVTYTLSWSDGNAFGSNKEGTTVMDKLMTSSLQRNIADTFEAGDTNIIWGDAVVGRRAGETITATVTPEASDAASYYDVNKVQVVTRSALSDTFIPSKGDIYDIGGNQGYIINIEGQGNDQEISFDLNPRETWDTYEYTITIDNVAPTTTP